MSYNGWLQVAFERDLVNDLTPATVGTTRLILVRAADGVRAFDAVCPHRGAHLAFGGRLECDRIVCPFHGYRIGLGRPAEKGFRVREYRTFVIGGLVFVSLSDSHEHGFVALMEELDKDHVFVPGFAMHVEAGPEIVIENAFDSAHFKTVHGIRNEPEFVVRPSRSGELTVEGTFEIPSTTREGDAVVRAHYVARAFSPYLNVSELRGESAYWVITGATPTTDGGSIIRLSLVARASADGAEPSAEWCRALLQYSRAGLEQDRVIWENMSATSPARLTARDATVVEFREFCRRCQPEAILGSDAAVALVAVARRSDDREV